MDFHLPEMAGLGISLSGLAAPCITLWDDIPRRRTTSLELRQGESSLRKALCTYSITGISRKCDGAVDVRMFGPGCVIPRVYCWHI